MFVVYMSVCFVCLDPTRIDNKVSLLVLYGLVLSLEINVELRISVHLCTAKTKFIVVREIEFMSSCKIVVNSYNEFKLVV